MTRTLIFAALAFATPAWAADPPLPATQFFTHTATGCRDLDLSSWHHPTRLVFEKKGLSLTRVQLCNNGKLPVFFAEVPYDPMGASGSFFNPLYAELRDANGGWPFAIVATSDNTIIFAGGKGRNINLQYEMYRQ